MALEYVYTSVPKGLKPGSYGFSAVACSRGLSDQLANVLENLSGYRRVYSYESGQWRKNPPACSHVTIESAGRSTRVLARVADAGVDYSKRTNKIACFFVLDENRDCVTPGPAALFDAPGLFVKEWSETPRWIDAPVVFPNNLPEPTQSLTWRNYVGDPGWAAALASTVLTRRPVLLVVRPDQNVLELFKEAIALLPPARRWDATFATYYTKTPPNVKCLWKAVIAGSPEETALQSLSSTLAIDLTNPATLPPLNAVLGNSPEELRMLREARGERIVQRPTYVPTSEPAPSASTVPLPGWSRQIPPSASSPQIRYHDAPNVAPSSDDIYSMQMPGQWDGVPVPGASNIPRGARPLNYGRGQSASPSGASPLPDDVKNRISSVPIDEIPFASQGKKKNESSARKWVWILIALLAVICCVCVGLCVWSLADNASFVRFFGGVFHMKEASENLNDAPKEEPVDAPKEEPTDAPKEEPTDAPKEEPTDAPKEEPTDAPKEEPTDAPKEEPTDAPKEEPTDAPKEEPADAPKEEPADAPKEEPTDAPKEEPTDAPKEEPTDAPKEEPADKKAGGNVSEAPIFPPEELSLKIQKGGDGMVELFLLESSSLNGEGLPEVPNPLIVSFASCFNVGYGPTIDLYAQKDESDTFYTIAVGRLGFNDNNNVGAKLVCEAKSGAIKLVADENTMKFFRSAGSVKFSKKSEEPENPEASRDDSDIQLNQPEDIKEYKLRKINEKAEFFSNEYLSMWLPKKVGAIMDPESVKDTWCLVAKQIGAHNIDCIQVEEPFITSTSNALFWVSRIKNTINVESEKYTFKELNAKGESEECIFELYQYIMLRFTIDPESSILKCVLTTWIDRGQIEKKRNAIKVYDKDDEGEILYTFQPDENDFRVTKSSELLKVLETPKESGLFITEQKTNQELERFQMTLVVKKGEEKKSIKEKIELGELDIKIDIGMVIQVNLDKIIDSLIDSKNKSNVKKTDARFPILVDRYEVPIPSNIPQN